jgi:hypothetical protein
MNPKILKQIMDWAVAALAAAPNIEALAAQIKTFFASLFHSGQIGKSTQDAVFAHVDATVIALLADTPPPSWTVEPDPPAVTS